MLPIQGERLARTQGLIALEVSAVVRAVGFEPTLGFRRGIKSPLLSTRLRAHPQSSRKSEELLQLATDPKVKLSGPEGIRTPISSLKRRGLYR